MILQIIFALTIQPNVAAEKLIHNVPPSWESPKKYKLPMYPIYGREGSTAYISIYGKDTQISDAMDAKLRKAWGDTSKGEFYLSGKDAEALLKELNIAPSGKFHFRAFDGESSHTLDLKSVKRVKIMTNGAGDGIFGTAGIEVPLTGSAKGSQAAIGLAWLGSESPFQASTVAEVSFKTSTLALRSQRELEDIAKSFVIKDQALSFKDAQESISPVGDWELVQVEMPMTRQGDYPEPLLGYFLKRGNQIVKAHDFYLGSDYSNKPERVVSGGTFIKGYKHILAFSSFGMGNCGKILLQKEDGTWIELEPSCGSWGC